MKTQTRTRTRTIPKTPFFAAFSVGAVLFSAHAGGGFATGNQANTYYVGLGWAGIVSAIVAMLRTYIVIRMLLCWCVLQTSASSYLADSNTIARVGRRDWPSGAGVRCALPDRPQEQVSPTVFGRARV